MKLLKLHMRTSGARIACTDAAVTCVVEEESGVRVTFRDGVVPWQLSDSFDSIVAQLEEANVEAASTPAFDSAWETPRKPRAVESEEATMPFGKYKGRLLDEIPSDYLNWLLGQGTVRPKLHAQLTACLEERGA